VKESRIIVALDGLTWDEMLRLIHLLYDWVAGFKFNDALDKNAMGILGNIRSICKEHILWADPKLHDIPNTVGNRMRNFSEMGATWVTVHASGGVAMMKKAVENQGKSRVIGVTVLTSLNEDDCMRIYRRTVAEAVKDFSLDVKEAGGWGLVCAPRDLPALSPFPEVSSLTKITPAIRPTWAVARDQKRPTTPAEAIKGGARYLVVGDPILRPPAEIGSPLEAAKLINQEVEEALASMQK
jgi:orotidine-5'-phosphate decarboxylase